jgi:hypothetical protein
MAENPESVKPPKKEPEDTPPSLPGTFRIAYTVIFVGLMILASIVGVYLWKSGAVDMRDMANQGVGAIVALLIMVATRFFKIGT